MKLIEAAMTPRFQCYRDQNGLCQNGAKKKSVFQTENKRCKEEIWLFLKSKIYGCWHVYNTENNLSNSCWVQILFYGNNDF